MQFGIFYKPRDYEQKSSYFIPTTYNLEETSMTLPIRVGEHKIAVDWKYYFAYEIPVISYLTIFFLRKTWFGTEIKTYLGRTLV